MNICNKYIQYIHKHMWYIYIIYVVYIQLINIKYSGPGSRAHGSKIRNHDHQHSIGIPYIKFYSVHLDLTLYLKILFKY